MIQVDSRVLGAASRILGPLREPRQDTVVYYEVQSVALLLLHDYLRNFM